MEILFEYPGWVTIWLLIIFTGIGKINSCKCKCDCDQN